VRGDTLYAIAWRYGLNYQNIADWNHLRSPDLIYVGQRLRLKPSPMALRSAADYREGSAATKPTQSKAKQTAKYSDSEQASDLGRTKDRPWSWPTEGRIVRSYQPNIPGGKGIDIGGKLGQPVRAASPGEVVYSGSGLPGYGRLIILRHSDSLLSAYGYLGRIFVKEGDKVEMGQSIAELGASGDNLPVLHFEIRQNGKPVNPLRFLPANSAGV
jgi:lipoprotein NlpD